MKFKFLEQLFEEVRSQGIPETTEADLAWAEFDDFIIKHRFRKVVNTDVSINADLFIKPIIASPICAPDKMKSNITRLFGIRVGDWSQLRSSIEDKCYEPYIIDSSNSFNEFELRKVM